MHAPNTLKSPQNPMIPYQYSKQWSKHLSLWTQRSVYEKNVRLLMSRYGTKARWSKNGTVPSLKGCLVRPVELDDNTRILICGVDHAEVNSELGDYVLAHPPKAVLVETALGAHHGRERGREFDLESALQDPQLGLFMSIVKGMSEKVREDGLSVDSAIWKEVKAQFRTELLLCVATLSLQAPLIFADRPKPDTFKRLISSLDIPSLDSSIEHAIVKSWVDTLKQYNLISKNQDDNNNSEGSPEVPDLGQDPLDPVFMGERDVCMAYTAVQASKQYSKSTDDYVILVVGEDHVTGIIDALKKKNYDIDINTLSGDKLPISTEQYETYCKDGLRRAMLEMALGMKVDAVVMQSLTETLGMIDDEAQCEVYLKSIYTYSCHRMSLALLPPSLLPCAVADVGGALTSSLQKLRNARPVNGGSGYSDEVLADLDQLVETYSPVKVLAKK